MLYYQTLNKNHNVNSNDTFEISYALLHINKIQIKVLFQGIDPWEYENICLSFLLVYAALDCHRRNDLNNL